MEDRKKVLMIDDEEDLCQMVKENLEEAGHFQVVTTTLPQEAKALCLREKPDVILLDIVMPQMSGLDITKNFRNDSQTAQIPIIVVSGLGEMTYFKKKGKWMWLPNRPVVQHRGDIFREKNPEKAAHAYGVEGYLTKPFRTEMLIEVIGEVLEKKRLQDQIRKQEEGGGQDG